MESEGYEVTGVASGLEAIEHARELPFDLVITDVRMDGMDGLEALAEVRAERPELESMVITGYADEADSIRAVRLGVGEYLKKPFNMDEFVTAVERLLGERRRRARTQESESAVRQAALWASHQMGSGQTQVTAAAELVWELAGELGFTYDESELLQLEVMLALLGYPRERPSPAQELLNGSEMACEVVTAITDLAQRKLLLPTKPYLGELPSDVLEQYAQIRSALEQLARFGSYGLKTVAEPGRWESLTSLGLGLIERGDFEGASQAFQSIAQVAPKRHSVKAMLELARLHLIRGEFAKTSEWARQASREAGPLGPSQTLSAWLTAASLLARAQDKASIELLERCRELDSSNDLGRTELARGLISGRFEEAELGRHLELLFRPGNLSLLMNSVGWLLPLLLESQSRHQSPTLTPYLSRLALQFPNQLGRIVSGREVSEAALSRGQRPGFGPRGAS